MAKFKDVVNKASDIIDVFTPVTKLLFPKATIPVVIAGEVLDNLTKFDDEILKDSVFGITATSLYLDEVVKDYKQTGKIDVEKIELVSENLKKIDLGIDKFYKLIS